MAKVTSLSADDISSVGDVLLTNELLQEDSVQNQCRAFDKANRDNCGHLVLVQREIASIDAELSSLRDDICRDKRPDPDLREKQRLVLSEQARRSKMQYQRGRSFGKNGLDIYRQRIEQRERVLIQRRKQLKLEEQKLIIILNQQPKPGADQKPVVD